MDYTNNPMDFVYLDIFKHCFQVLGKHFQNKKKEFIYINANI